MTVIGRQAYKIASKLVKFPEKLITIKYLNVIDCLLKKGSQTESRAPQDPLPPPPPSSCLCKRKVSQISLNPVLVLVLDYSTKIRGNTVLGVYVGEQAGISLRGKVDAGAVFLDIQL